MVNARSMTKMLSSNGNANGASSKHATVYMAFSAVTLGLIQSYFLPSEVNFGMTVCTFCLVVFAAIADPETFHETVPLVRSILPRNVYSHILKSIECLQEGDRRVHIMKQNKNKGDGSISKDKSCKDHECSNEMLFDEIKKRTQWRFVIPAILCGACVKVIQYKKPKVMGQMSSCEGRCINGYSILALPPSASTIRDR